MVVVLRERKGRTLPFVVRREAEGAEIVQQRVALGSELHADEGPHWDELEFLFNAHRINHSEAFSWDGACTNQAESYFSRLRRAVDGQHHHVSKQYLHQYANEAAWREDHRRTANGGAARGRAGGGAALAGQPGLEGLLAAGRRLSPCEYPLDSNGCLRYVFYVGGEKVRAGCTASSKPPCIFAPRRRRA